MIIAGECRDWIVALEIEDIARTAIISSRMRELSNLSKYKQSLLY